MVRLWAVTVVGFAAMARGQCGYEWVSNGTPPGMSSPVNATVQWDPDGPGPATPVLIAGGDFTSAGGVSAFRVARWNGQSWAALGNGLNGSAYAAITWDFDGGGPELAQVVVAGQFTQAGSAFVSNIAKWNGTAWSAIGGSFNGPIRAMCSWDPDGDGPLPARLVIGGDFTGTGSNPNKVGYWNGTSWQTFGAGFVSGGVYALASWDPDGSGPLPPRLVAAGTFPQSGTTTTNRIAIWDGAAWQPLSTGMTGVIYALCSWDPDGDGPVTPKLLAGGSFTTAGGVNAPSLAAWDGSSWQSTGVTSGNVRSLLSRDPDGAGPLNPQVYVGGQSIAATGTSPTAFAKWDGATWTALGAQISGLGIFSITDSTVPGTVGLVTGGNFLGGPVGIGNHIGMWDGKAWRPLGSGFDGPLTSLFSWDPDGTGPSLPVLAAGGAFTAVGGTASFFASAWNGAWGSIGNGTGWSVTSLSTWDADGAGGAPAAPVAGIYRVGDVGQVYIYVMRWTGVSWSLMGGSFYNTSQLGIYALGTLPTGELVCGGNFLNNDASGTTYIRYVGYWGGTQWQPFGSGGLGEGIEGEVRALATGDLDGAGPLPSQLVAGGLFTFGGALTLNHVARWTGGTWQPVGTGVDGNVRAMLFWDRDGAGPLPPQLVVAGDFLNAGGAPASRIALWDGVSWQPLGGGVNGSVYALCLWDPDGPGPADTQLVAGGAFTQAAGSPANRVASFDGTAWHAIGAGVGGQVSSLGTWDPDGAGPEPAWLGVGGSFTAAAGSPSSYFAWARPVSPSVISSQPQPVSIAAGGDAVFSVGVDGFGPRTYRWRKGAVPLTDGVSPSGSVISGAATIQLQVHGAQPADAGGYDCVITNACGPVTSDSATLTVSSCYPDCDGVGGLTGNDFQCFLNKYVTGDPYANCDGVGGLTGNDFQCFLNAYVAGCS